MEPMRYTQLQTGRWVEPSKASETKSQEELLLESGGIRPVDRSATDVGNAIGRNLNPAQTNTQGRQTPTNSC